MKKRKRQGLSIKRRDRYVRVALGFASFDSYLGSDLWTGISARALAASNKCKLCGNLAEVAAHLVFTWPNLRGTSEYGIVVLCRGCYETNNTSAVAGTACVTREKSKIRKNPYLLSALFRV